MKTWKPLAHFLINIIIVNSFLLSSYRYTDHRATRQETHKQFRKDLRKALFEASTRVRKLYTQEPQAQPSTDDILWYPTPQHKLIKLWVKPINCSAYIEASRKSHKVIKKRRKPLSELSTNTTKKPRDSKD